MVKLEHQAQIDARLVPIRAEAWALKVATVGVTFMPWFAILAAIAFVVAGYDVAAVVSAAVGVVGSGAQIIQATRRPRVVQQVSPASTAPSGSRDKSGPTAKRPKKSKK